MSLRLSVYFWLIALLAAAVAARALPADPRQPIEIEAARMVMNQQTGVSTYTGEVTLTQGSIRIEAEKLVVYVRNRKLHRLEAFGTDARPAFFRQQLAGGGETGARAGHMEYRTAESRLILRQQAELRQGSSHIRSERIDYNTASNSLIAGQQDPGQQRERVRIVIEPDDDNPKRAE